MTDEIKCPKCSSSQIMANKKGLSIGKAAVGGILLGPLGLLGGGLGKDKIIISCLKCGNQWNPGQ